MIDETPVIMFARIKPGHCAETIAKSKRFSVLWNKDEEQVIAQISRTFYDCEHRFLINHPFLSCFTEIQRIILKPWVIHDGVKMSMDEAVAKISAKF